MTERGYTLELEERDGYLVARVEGETDTVAVSLRYWGEVATRCRAMGYDRVLVLERFGNAATLAEIYEVATQLPRIVSGLRVAFVDANADELEGNRFGEDIATNRGADGRVFTTIGEAERWLAGTHKE